MGDQGAGARDELGSATVACDSCGAEIPPRSRFCLECGESVAARATREVRKTVTLLFTDVTGSTAMGEDLDPEVFRAVMTRYFDCARVAIERHGGTVEKFVGDAVLAVFGVPEIHEDDALRAVRAAIELNRAVNGLSRELTETLGVTLTIRTGVNTGSVVTGSARAGGSFATGDAVNTAARLEQAAGPGEILLGADTYALVRDAVVVEPVAPVPAKGKAEPLEAHRLVEVLDARRGRNRRMEARLVGRARERQALDDALERTLESGRGHLVTVLGSPGIGKTRLVAEFLAGVGDRAGVISGRCVSYGQGITYWPVAQVLRQAAGLSGLESDEVTRHGLLRLLGGAPDRDDVTDLLLPLLGKGGEPGGSDQTFWAVRRALEEVATRGPVVVSFDDLHWAEPTLLDLIDRVRDEVRDLPLLLVCQARPELLDSHPTWGGGSANSVTFGLEPFTEDQTAASLSEQLGGHMPAEVATAVANWAGGNPLFTEELAGHLVHTGLLRRDGETWRLTGDLTGTQLPPTVAALLAARLDRLPEDERTLLERVSVIGLELTTDDAVSMASDGLGGAAVSRLLAALARRDVLHRRRDARGDTWAFRHILVRDAAYQSLPKAARADLHERFADLVEAGAGAAGSERIAFAAHHLEQAVRLRRQLNPLAPVTAGLAERAATALALAADQARDREDLTAATSLLERAVDLEVSSSALQRELLGRLAQTLRDQERIADTQAVLEQFALAIDDTATDLDRAHLACQLLDCRLQGSETVDPDEVDAAAADAASLARAAGDDRRLFQALLVRCWVRAFHTRWAAVEEFVAEAFAVAGPQDRRGLDILTAAILIYGPQPMPALAAFAEERLAAPHLSAAERHVLLSFAGIAAAAADSSDTERFLALAEAGADGTPDAINLCIGLASAYQQLAASASAVAWFERVRQACRVSGALAVLSTYSGFVAALRLDLGHPVESVQPIIDEAVTYASPLDLSSVALLTCARSVIAARSGDLDLAATLADEAIRVKDVAAISGPRQTPDGG